MKQSKSFKLLLSIALTLMLVCSSWAQSTAVRRIGVLTPGGDFGPVLEGLREGLAQLGYVEGKQVSFIVEDTKMEALDPVKAAMRLIAAKPDLLVTVATSHAAAAKQVAEMIQCSQALWRATSRRRTILPESRTVWRRCPASGSRC